MQVFFTCSLGNVLGGGEYNSFLDRMEDLGKVFVKNAWAGALYHVKFLHGLAAIFHVMMINLIKLFPALDSALHSTLATSFFQKTSCPYNFII